MTAETPNGIEIAVSVLNEQGLHARPAARLAKEAQRFMARVTLVAEDMEVDAKSILDILSLAAAKGTLLTVRCCGADAQLAADAMADLFHNRFKE